MARLKLRISKIRDEYDKTSRLCIEKGFGDIGPFKKYLRNYHRWRLNPTVSSKRRLYRVGIHRASILCKIPSKQSCSTEFFSLMDVCKTIAQTADTNISGLEIDNRSLDYAKQFCEEVQKSQPELLF